MISIIKSVLNMIMTFFLCYFIGHSLFVVWDYKTSPELYAMQSAPWYISILITGIVTAVVVVICILIKFVMNYIGKTKQP